MRNGYRHTTNIVAKYRKNILPNVILCNFPGHLRTTSKRICYVSYVFSHGVRPFLLVYG